ncbi:Hypothetical_protein [Hexamita inflata]|uniref:Hypothetical_protein n=1 Tax=Hexamita inflata TaxID=28002 RepID=A0AA86TPM8_9EUKA|nr:Hypothetical protein HINF_LOCUS6543 [Hexamita inflata]
MAGPQEKEPASPEVKIQITRIVYTIVKTSSSVSFWQQIQSEIQFFIVVRCSKSRIWLLSSSNYLMLSKGLRGSTETMQLSRKSMYLSLDRAQIPTRFVSFVLLIVSERRFFNVNICLTDCN